MYYLYIIYSVSVDKYYVGSSDDPWRRLVGHNNSPFNSFTSKHRPWELKAVFEAGTTRGAAEGMERFVKRQKSRTLLKKMIDPNFGLTGRLAQLVRVPHVRD